MPKKKTTSKNFKIRRRLFNFDSKNTVEDQSTSKSPIPKKYILLAIIVVAIGVGSYLGFNQYQTWLTSREQVADFINDNTAIYNQTSQSSQEIVLSLNSLVQFDQEQPEEVGAQLESINEKILDIEQVVTTIENNAAALKEPPVEDAQAVQTKFQDSLESKKATLLGLEDFLQYQTCLISSSNRQSTSLEQFKVNIEGFTNAGDSTPLEDKLQFVASAKEKINSNIQINQELPNCFDGNFSRYYTNKIKADLSSDTQLYQNYITNLDKLSEGLQTTDSPKVQEATDQLVTLASQSPIFYESDQFKQAIEQPTEEIRIQAEALEKQEELLSRSISELKAKYLL